MYKAIIVDDEKWVVESFRKGIDWNKYGFEVIGSASDGMEAYEMLCALQPDLVLVDIRMPVMGGLELIRKAKQEFTDMEFVVVSGYAEFAYAQKALNYGAAGYCLKPLEEEELSKVLGMIKSRLDRNTRTVVDIMSVLEDATENGDSSQALQDAFDWDEENGMHVIVFSGKWNSEFAKYCSAVLSLSVNRRGCFVKESNLQECFEFLNQLEDIDKLDIGISRKVINFEYVNDAIQEAQVAVYQYFLSGQHGLHEYKSASRGELRQLIQLIVKGIDQHDQAAITNCYNQMRQLFKKETYNIRHAFYAWSRILDKLYEYGNTEDQYDIENYIELTSLFSGIEEMIEFLCRQSIDVFADSQTNGVVSRSVIKDILSFLENNYNKDISMSTLADKYYLSLSYLCRIFKKEVGMPFTSYLSNLRLAHACILLRSTNMSVYEVAESCGYKDYFYFARLFKRTVKITPSQYRAGENGDSVELIHNFINAQ